MKAFDPEMTALRKLAGLLAIAALLALATATSASAVTIGEDVNNTAGVVNTSGCAALPCTWMNTAVPLGAAPRKIAFSPCNGTVTTWRVNAGAAGDSVKLRLIKDDDGSGTTYTSTATSSPGTTAVGVKSFTTSLPITAGQYIGLDIPNSADFKFRPATAGQASQYFVPQLIDGTPNPRGVASTQTLLYNADVSCNGISPILTGGEKSPSTGSDIVRPRFETVSATNTVFAPGGTSSTARRRVKRGTRFRYRLSEAATVKISIFRLTRGRRVGRRCRKATRRRRHRPRCTRSVKKGTLSAPGKAGKNSKFFSGRLRGKALRRGKYKATFSAKDSAGNKARSRTLRFRIVSARRKR